MVTDPSAPDKEICRLSLREGLSNRWNLSAKDKGGAERAQYITLPILMYPRTPPISRTKHTTHMPMLGGLAQLVASAARTLKLVLAALIHTFGTKNLLNVDSLFTEYLLIQASSV